VLLAAVVGTVLEWFDFFLYSVAAALVLGAAFFPGNDPAVATILAFSTIAVGFLSRPIGAVIFGHLGDKLGRKASLVLTLWIMGSATVATGLLPTYHQIGVLAPILLVGIRVIQGIGVGGEYGGAVLMVLEHSRNPKRRGVLGSIPNACASAGFLLASGVMALLTSVMDPEQFQAWGWRIPFIASFIIVLLGYYIRRRVEDSPVFQQAQERKDTEKVPLAALVRNEPLALFVAFAVPCCVAIAYNIVLVYFTSYVVTAGVEASTMLIVSTLAQAIYIPLIIGWGALSDRIGRRLPMVIGIVGATAWMFVAFPLVGTQNPSLIFVAIAVSLVFIAGMYGPQAAFLTSLFRPQFRYSGISIGYQVAFAVAGGLTPVIAAALYAEFESWVPIAIYLACGAVLSLVAVIASRRIPTRQYELDDTAAIHAQVDGVSGMEETHV